jgi:oligosaccharide reducing-end xylanase
MKKKSRCFLILALAVFAANPFACSHRATNSGSYFTSIYPNLFSELLGPSQARIQSKIDSAFQQLFYGDDSTQRVYYPVAPDMAYIEDILHHDVRTEGISYGMMIAVQLDKKDEFDRLWKWAKTFMQHQEGPSRGFFAWHCAPDGKQLSISAASDGEEWIVTALFFASGRWGDGPGILNYRAEAQAILDAMLSKETASDEQRVITNMFNRDAKQVVFVPNGEADGFTDPSYHLPHYYELWARWADNENAFWCQAAAASRAFLKKAAHLKTGLTPDYAHFDGSAMDAPWGGGHDGFCYDAWRTSMNIAVDWIWFHKDDWAVIQSNRLLKFFHSEGMKHYGGLYSLDGKRLADEQNPGLVAMNGAAALAANTPLRTDFVKAVWEMPIPDGPGRYYDGLLYMLAMLQISGNFKIHDPFGVPVPACQEN